MECWAADRQAVQPFVVAALVVLVVVVPFAVAAAPFVVAAPSAVAAPFVEVDSARVNPDSWAVAALVADSLLCWAGSAGSHWASDHSLALDEWPALGPRSLRQASKYTRK